MSHLDDKTYFRVPLDDTAMAALMRRAETMRMAPVDILASIVQAELTSDRPSVIEKTIAHQRLN